MKMKIWSGGLLAALIMTQAATPGAQAWGWIGHRLITHLALEKLPPEVRALYTGQEAALDASTTHPDAVAMVNPHEAMHHFVNIEVLDPGFVKTLATIAPLPAEPPPPAPGAAAPAAAAAASSGQTGDGSHNPGHDLELRGKELTFFTPKWPYATGAADKLFAVLPKDRRALDAEFTEAEQSGLGTVDYQPAGCFLELVNAIRAKNTPDIIYWTGKLSHYIGDAHQPLHNTVNHDGKISGNEYVMVNGAPLKGQEHSVHSRFEAGMLKFMGTRLDDKVRPLVGAPKPLDPQNLTALTMAASRGSYALIPQVLAADQGWFSKNKLPVHLSSEKDWEPYYTAMEAQIGPIAESQLAKASQMLADALVTAFQVANAK